jgi:hypothetical protein
VEVFHHFVECAELVQELGTVREEDAAEERASARGPLTAEALKVGGVKWSGVGDGAVVFGMFSK